MDFSGPSGVSSGLPWRLAIVLEQWKIHGKSQGIAEDFPSIPIEMEVSIIMGVPPWLDGLKGNISLEMNDLEGPPFMETPK